MSTNKATAKLKKGRKVLIIVENLPMPFDTRVHNEACALRDAGYDVTVLCPRGKGYERGVEVWEGIRIYRHPMAGALPGVSGYLIEYTAALFWETLYTWWILMRHGVDVIQGCNPPDSVFLVVFPSDCSACVYFRSSRFGSGALRGKVRSERCSMEVAGVPGEMLVS